MKNSFSKKASTGSEVERSPAIKHKPFTPTKEQSYCNTLLKQEQILKMEAVAGSGKSSTLYYLGRENPEPSLGLVFNKTMALEATEKSPDNIKWCTTHSLAYRAVGKMYQHKLSRPKGRYVNVALTGAEIARYFKLPDFYFDQDSASYVSKAYLGLIIRDTVNQFEISVDQEIEQKHVPFHHIKDLTKKYGDMFPKKKFVGLVFRRAKELWEERKDIYSDVMMNHNSYLKLYHLSNPDLSEYKIIYVDESQDINPVTMDIIMKQKDKCKIVFVGDNFQSIYQFNGAVNAMSKIKAPSCSLTKSFRFGQTIADVANTILRGKVNVVGNENIQSVASGEHGTVDTSKPYTILFRTNMELIFQSVKMITEGKDVNVNTDLKDFMALVKSAEALHKGDLKQVKHENILPFNTWDELLDEAKVDGELSRVSTIVENDQTEHIVKVLHTYKSNPNAHINILSAHRSKGLQFKQIILWGDYPSNYDHKGRFVGLSDQEENLLYVAATRAEEVLQWNSTVQELIDLN